MSTVRQRARRERTRSNAKDGPETGRPEDAARAALRSRIVGEGEEAPDQLLANPFNFRVHPKTQIDALEGVLSAVGWVQRVIVNRRTGHIVDGHARVTLALQRSEKTVPVLFVDLDEKEEKTVLAAFDRIASLAGEDEKILETLLRDVADTENASLASLFRDMADDHGLLDKLGFAGGDDPSIYTAKIEVPIYTPTGERPPISALFDAGRATALLKEISDSGLPEPEKDFLRTAAMRHVVFDYRMIAEWYCHATPEAQALMEKSALVIIDSKKAIESGFVVLSDRLREIYDESWPDDDGMGPPPKDGANGNAKGSGA